MRVAGLVLLLWAGGCEPSSRTGSPEVVLWKATVEPYLLTDPWEPGDDYDAGHVLMVPLHAAFLLGEERWIAQFAVLLGRYLAVADRYETTTATRLDRFHFFYLCSRFLVLAQEGGRSASIPAGLAEHLETEVRASWQELPAWQWDRADFAGGIRERLAWKLSDPPASLSYYPAVIDEERFLLAIAADLCAYRRAAAGSLPTAFPAQELLDAAADVYGRRGAATPEGGWLFQPGTFTDHPDYAYAGNLDVGPALLPSPVPGIAEDASHSHRLALWIRSHRAADPARDGLYASILAGLERQFMERVLVAPSPSFPGFRTTNFMDGRNGVYRWQYPSQGAGKGFGPGQLSGTLLLGWWSFLGTQRTRELHAAAAGTFPLAPAVIETYVGPNTTRPRSPFVREPDFYTNGFAELILRLAARLPLLS
jgi:hypothetical protein